MRFFFSSRLFISLVSSFSLVAGLIIGDPVLLAVKGTYPRAIRLQDGSLLATLSYATPGALAGYQVIATVTSHDEGNTWQDYGVVIDQPGDNWNQFLLQLPDGRVLCAVHDHQYAEDQKTFTEFRTTIFSSDDLGKTWSPLSVPERRKAALDPDNNGMWEPFLRLSNDGVLQLYYSSENNRDDQNSLLRTSIDGGKSWSNAKTISGGDVRARDGMLGVANYGGSKLIAVFETTLNGHFEVWSVKSEDDGATWGPRQRVYATEDPKANAGAPQVSFVGGTLVCSFMTDEDKPLGQWAKGAAMKVLTSIDGGGTWTDKTTIFSNEPSTYWPGLLTLDNNTFTAMVEQDGPKAKKVQLKEVVPPSPPASGCKRRPRRRAPQA
ncbi:Sialidase [Auriculariales sp. MPI-PUGE-AT-0066]|nr:Sialidase [Auriculariales sp. MPI-PUGE-AT-0066]